MADFIIVAIVADALFVLLCLWQVLTLLSGWRPALARVWRSDYTRDQQREDFWSFGMTAFTSRGYNWRDGEDTRLVEDEIVFTGDDGREHRALMQRQVARGWQPTQNYGVWYNPANPAQVTVRGPLYWSFLAILSLVVAGLLVRALLALGGVAQG
ncbi:DUF3592 domain-containing protein [Novosphingobium sp.]|uniref:DUF3592 domain-containing protein n=1 Tax=Novosphingobium sp. TaxID=1874826 RepID=UPI0038BC335C